jgi:uncharacterized protein (TIGR03663 family)
MKWSTEYRVLLLGAICTALALRLPQLQQRPMHTDEAVHAIKFGALLEDGHYRYDSYEYHGPTLNYLTLIPAWFSSATKITEVDETTLRIVPVFFGVLLVLMVFLLKDGLGWHATIMAALLTAVSPAMAYYSRYNIQEMLLVCFTLGAIICGYRYFTNRKSSWAIGVGVFIGLMHATKETCIIAYGAMLAALFLTRLHSACSPATQNIGVISNPNAIPHTKGSQGVVGRGEKSGVARFQPKHIIAAAVATVVISVLFYSSFFTNPSGIMDSILAYKTYLTRAGQNAVHIHPWYFYLKMLLFSKYGSGPIWSEAFIVIFAGVGLVAAMRRKNLFGSDPDLAKFLAYYALIMTIIYSAIPYKTPWSMLGFFHGIILLAGIGAAFIIESAKKKWIRVAIIGIITTGCGHLAWQAYLANFIYFEDSTNPYVYAHTTSDIYKVVERLEEIASVHPEGKNMRVDIVFPGSDYWPLPWYLREFPNVGWWDKVDESAPAAPVVIAAAGMESELIRKFYELPPPGQRSLYVSLFDSYTELRPKVELRGYVRKDLWDRME